MIPGAEPFAFGGEGVGGVDGGKADGVLFLHGWTSSPRELRFLAERIAPLGFRCEGILLAGHGTTLADLSPTRYADYLAQSREAYASLAKRCRRVFLCGLSMGGLLALHLALESPVAGLLLIAPFIQPSGRTFGLPNRWLIGRVPLPPMLGKNPDGPIADQRARPGHIAYPAMPSASMVSVVRAARGIMPSLPRIQSPVLIFHAVPDRTSDFRGSMELMARLGTEDKTLVAFNRGNHVITLDFPRARLEERTLAWLQAHCRD